MYQKAKETIQRLEKVLDEKNHLILQLKENKDQDSEILAKVKSISTEIATTFKTDNHQEASNQSPNQT